MRSTLLISLGQETMLVTAVKPVWRACSCGDNSMPITAAVSHGVAMAGTALHPTRCPP